MSQNTISRREFMKLTGTFGVAAGLGVLGGGFLTGCNSAKTGQISSLSAQQGWIKDCEFLGYYAADLKGYYKDEGLQVDFAPGGAGVNPSQLVDAKQKDIALQSTSLGIVQANATGAQLMAFGTLNQRSPAGLMYIIEYPDGRPGYVIDAPEKCKGQRIGIQGGPNLPWQVICKQAGLDVNNDMTIVNVSYDPTPLTDGTVVGYWCFATSQPNPLIRQGYKIGILDAYQWGYKVPGDFLLTRKDTITNNKDKIVGFLRASIRGWVYANAHVDEMVKYVVDNFGKDNNLVTQDETDLANAQIPYQISDFEQQNGLFAMNMEDWANCNKILKDMGELTTDLAVTDYATTEIFDAVYANGRIDKA